MSWPFDLTNINERLNFENDRVKNRDAVRQINTVRAVLQRLGNQPGVILADEVGMGKTFVALGVAMIAALEDKARRPVVIMVPPSLQEKWIRDFGTFKDFVVRSEKDHKRLTIKYVESALDFFNLIDNPLRERPGIILLKHGAFLTKNLDHWIQLALIKRAIHGMHLGEKRTALPRFVASIIRTKSSYNDPELFEKLFSTPNQQWREVIDLHYPDDPLEDDPIPEALDKIINSADIDIEKVRDCLRELPARVRSQENLDRKLDDLRGRFKSAVNDMWPKTLAQAKFRSPLLILDEAHHLKNPATKMASLFISSEGGEAANDITGALRGKFERMMFLTATPFQLGHYELCNVINIFGAIDWKALPAATKGDFDNELKALIQSLDHAQGISAELDKRWGLFKQDDLLDAEGNLRAPDQWWNDITTDIGNLPEHHQSVMRVFEDARSAMKQAKTPLKKWVIRHLRDRWLPNTETPRRERRVGQALSLKSNSEEGLPITGDALLPFLLATRAQAIIRQEGKGRALFAEGLASSYEAFLETGVKDEETDVAAGSNERASRYIGQIEKHLKDGASYALHPKVAPLVERVISLWEHGEKVVIFCHYIETGKALLKHVSSALNTRLWKSAAKKFKVGDITTRERVQNFGDRFDEGGGMRQPLDDEIDRRLSSHPELNSTQQDAIKDVVRRFIKTPLFVARYFDIEARSGGDALRDALKTKDSSGQTLGDKIDRFLDFISRRCSDTEREHYLEALLHVQPGIRGEITRSAKDDLFQIGDSDVRMPNVRLANGDVNDETRKRLMLAFNTPFFPEILIASSVLAEGVDLHLNCRYIIHHDLSWNPSTIEQRTGRVDRIGAKAEMVEKPIEIYLPFVGGTQDEKQYRVVMDRERWFQVVMDGQYRTDESYTEKVAERVPLPKAGAEALKFDLSIPLSLG